MIPEALFWSIQLKRALNPLSDIASLFFAPVCAACGRELGQGENLLCNTCRWEIPLTRFWEQEDNPLTMQLRENIPSVERAAAFFFFVHDSPFRDLIHDFKYRRRPRLASMMGQWFGAETGSFFLDIDLIIPVPLYFLRRLRRGYNQSAHLARGLSEALGKPVDLRSVYRCRNTRAQARRDGREERWENVEGAFAVRNPQKLRGRHLLLVDDVLTTGATITAFAEVIAREIPDCKISVAVLATTPRSASSYYGK